AAEAKESKTNISDLMPFSLSGVCVRPVRGSTHAIFFTAAWNGNANGSSAIRLRNAVVKKCCTILAAPYCRRPVAGLTACACALLISLYSMTDDLPFRRHITPTFSLQSRFSTTLLPHSAFWSTQNARNDGSPTFTNTLSTP